jgi:hypothetical protein
VAAKPYDVAISFLFRDEPLARQLADLLSPANVFVYSKRQETLAGNNGAEEFRDTFRNKTRVVVVLYRPGWGQTAFTRIEEIAIQEYCMDEGWENLMFVQVEEGPVPKWVPKPHIPFDLQTFPIEQLVGAIKGKLLALGVALRPMTAAEVARQAAARERFDRETHEILIREANVYRDAVLGLFAEVERQVAEIVKEPGWEIVFGHDQTSCIIFFDRVTLQFLRPIQYVNRLEEAELKIRHFDGRLLTPQERARGMMVIRGEAAEVSREAVSLARDPALGWAWRRGERLFPSQEIVRSALTDFIERRTAAMKGR